MSRFLEECQRFIDGLYLNLDPMYVWWQQTKMKKNIAITVQEICHEHNNNLQAKFSERWCIKMKIWQTQRSRRMCLCSVDVVLELWFKFEIIRACEYARSWAKQIHVTRCKSNSFMTMFDKHKTWLGKFYLGESWSVWNQLSNGSRATITWVRTKKKKKWLFSGIL